MWKDRLYMILPVFLVVLVILNVISFFLNRDKVNDLKDRYTLSYVSFTNELVNLRSSYLQTASNLTFQTQVKTELVVEQVNTNSVVDSLQQRKEMIERKKQLCLKSCPYRYLLYNGRRVIQYYGRLYEEGSPMSLGRIARIYPDRVYFEDGSYIENTRNPDSVEVSHFQHTTKDDSL